MKTATEISGDKINLFMQDHMERLDTDIKAMYRKHSAEGKLRSGATFSTVMSLIKESFLQLSEFMSEQYTWTTNESLVVNNELVKTLKEQGKFYLEQFHKHSIPHMKEAARIVGKESFFERFMPEINESLSNAYSKLEAHIDTISLERKNKGIKGLLKAIPGLLSKVFGK